MSAQDGSVCSDHEKAVVEFAGFPVLFGTGEEQGHSELSGESGHVGHPLVRLGQDPLRPDAAGEGIAGHDQFRREDPACAEPCGGGERRLDEPTVSYDVARDRSEMEERDP